MAAAAHRAPPGWRPDSAEIGRRHRRLGRLTALLGVAAIGAIAWAGMTVQAGGRPPHVDPSLGPLPADGPAELLRLALGVIVGTALASAGILAARWLRATRGSLEILVGVPIDPRHPGRPPVTSARHWQPLLAAVRPDRDAWWATERVADSRRSAAVALALLVAGAAAVIVGVLVGTIIRAGPATDAATTLQAAGGVLTGVGAALAIPVLRTIRRREAIALANVARGAPPPAPASRVSRVLIGLPLAFAIGVSVGGPSVGSTCEVEDARCIELVVPAHRDAPDPRATMRVRFAVYPGRLPDARLLVVAVGGPGASGLEAAEWRLGAFDPRLRDAFDIVFFDPRGVGASHGRDCPVAAEGWARAAVDDPDAARAFAERCVSEAGVAPAELARYTTGQVAGDLELLRVHLGHERLSIYAESYGTELAQAYAAAYPQRVEALVLDGPVDLALEPHEFWLEAARGFGATLEATFDECDTDELCRADLPDPAGAYDDLVERLDAGPVSVDVNDGSGTTRMSITRPTWESVVASAMYDRAGRSVVLRALAEAGRGDLEFVGRLVGDETTVWDPGGISTFTYYAVTCGDEPFAAVPGDAAGWIAHGERAGVTDERLGSVYYAGLPCVHWPSPPADGVPALTDAPFPVVVLTATADPITRAAAGRAIVARQPQGYLVESHGGSHVTFASGDPCVDDPVLALLVDGTRPRSRTTCVGWVTDGHYPLTPLDAGELTGPLEAAETFETELLVAPELYWWDGLDDLRFGCRFGGSSRLDFDGSQLRVTLADCEWSRGLAVDATGTLDPETWALRLDLVGDGIDARYVSDIDEWSLEGTWDGEPVSIDGLSSPP